MSNKTYVPGFKAEFLGITPGQIGKLPIGVLVMRLHPKQSFETINIMVDRPTLERMVEDIIHVLGESPMLQKGEPLDEGMTAAALEMMPLEPPSAPEAPANVTIRKPRKSRKKDE